MNTINIKPILIFTLVSILSLGLSSCKKEQGCTDPEALNYKESAEEDDGSCEFEEEVTAEITITSPEAGKTFMGGQTVNIEATIAATGEIHGYEVILINTSTDEHVMHIEEHTHELTTEINESWDNDVDGHSDMELTIKAIIDHDGNQITETVNFHCHPMM